MRKLLAALAIIGILLGGCCWTTDCCDDCDDCCDDCCCCECYCDCY